MNDAASAVITDPGEINSPISTPTSRGTAQRDWAVQGHPSANNSLDDELEIKSAEAVRLEHLESSDIGEQILVT